MKTAIPFILAILAGAGIGLWGTSREFTGEQLPTKAVLLVMSEQENTTQVSEEPKLIVEGGETFDFGHLDVGSKGSHRFVLRNDGKQPLVITKGDSTCKCTTSSADGGAWKKGEKRTIDPGKNLPIIVEWTIKPQQEREFSQTAEFTTTDPRRNNLRLSILGKTSQAVELEQPEFIFSNISSNVESRGELKLYGFRPEPVSIVKHEWLSSDQLDKYQIVFEPLTPEEVARQQYAVSGVKMIVTIKPGLPVGSRRQGLRLTTSFADLKEPLLVPVNVTVVGDITLAGSGVFKGRGISLGSVDQTTGKKATVFLLVKGPHREETQIEVERIEPAGAFIARLEQPDPSVKTAKRIPLVVEVPPGSPLINLSGSDGSERGKIHLKTTHPSMPTMMIDVAFVIR